MKSFGRFKCFSAYIFFGPSSACRYSTMLLLVSGSRRVVRGDLVGSEGVVINRHFVDGPVEPLSVVPSVGADLDLVGCVEQERNTPVGYRADRRPINIVSRTPPSDHRRDVVPDVPLEVERHAAGR